MKDMYRKLYFQILNPVKKKEIKKSSWVCQLMGSHVIQNSPEARFWDSFWELMTTVLVHTVTTIIKTIGNKLQSLAYVLKPLELFSLMMACLRPQA